jgi:hypothetical protein
MVLNPHQYSHGVRLGAPRAPARLLTDGFAHVREIEQRKEQRKQQRKETMSVKEIEQ